MIKLYHGDVDNSNARWYYSNMNKQYPTAQVNKKQWRVHRYIMEQHLGRKLLSNELVHHINGDRYDNRIENLDIVTRSEHKKIHPEIGVKTRFKQKHYFNKYYLLKLRTSGLSTYEIAEIYCCSKPTIWRALKKHGIQ